MEWTTIVGIGGWLLAITQFIFRHKETKNKNESELLEKTLSYFERGTQARSIAISLVDGIWLKKEKNLEVILPVLISQVTFLLNDATHTRQESRNLIRLLHLIQLCLPYAIDIENETAEISEALLDGALNPTGVKISDLTLENWYAKFNNGDVSLFISEMEEIRKYSPT